MADQNNQDDDSVWNPPNQSQYVSVTTSSLDTTSVTPSSEQSYSRATTVQAYAHSQYEAAGSSTCDLPQYQEVRQHFPPHYSMEGGSHADLYQAAHSTYERISPVEDYHEEAESSGVSSYSTLQPVQPEGNPLIAAPVVDSSTLHHAYNTLRRVDLYQDERNATTTSYVVAQVTSMPSFVSNSEVSTSGGSPIMPSEQGLDDAEANQAISSIGSSLHGALMSHPSHKQDALEHSGEPDTTQEDVNDYHMQPHGSRSYMPHSATMESEGLHSTMSSTFNPSPVIMDPTMDSSQLHSSVSMDATLDTSGDVGLDSSIDKSVGSSVIGNTCRLDHSSEADNLVSGSDSALEQSYESIDDENKENDPQSTQRGVRKSSRIAFLDQEQASSSWRPRTYVPKPYNPDELWCEECMTSYPTDCQYHRLQIVLDKVVLSRAWSSLPAHLQIFRLSESGGTELGVFAKRPIPKFTQFGPFVGELVDSQDKLVVRKFLLMLEKPDRTIGFFETSDENKCNWMMFVRPAANFSEQNLVAYQHKQDIYFTVTKNIEPKHELKVWYASHYAERMGLSTLEITEQDIEALDEQDSRFPCYECNRRFKTSVLLQRHLLTHEDAGPSNAPDDEDYRAADDAKRGASSLKSSIMRSRARTVKKDGESSGYQWKKKSTSIYLNKTLKKYQRRNCNNKIRQTIKSLYKRKGKDSGGNEWVCMHCDLTFDNSNLLNLHTLTHAAEDVALDEIKKFAVDVNVVENSDPNAANGENRMENGENLVSLETYLACPMCHIQFANKRDLIEHAAEHGKTKSRINPNRPHKCSKCWKAFGTQERLQRHLLCHGEEDSKPLQCNVCYKRFMNNSALACHMKTHSDHKYYECPLCRLGFDQVNMLKAHITLHASDGLFTCPACSKKFDDYTLIRKHMRTFHPDKKYPCPDCDKIFPRPDKLKLHMLRHSAHREFMCENCGRQFKRKDKLKEHIKRMHSVEREAKNQERDKPSIKKFVPKVSPNDYHRFIYKCHTCLLGFKRRGMLVNHLAKRHPDLKPECIPELNLPILKTQRDYYCQYCDKVYKSSSKRKAHIIKNHPGAELPMSSRKRNLIPEIPGLPNPTYSQTVGSITTMPHSCTYCHKQYASKAKLMQHQRKKHPDSVPAATEKRKSLVKEELYLLEAAQAPVLQDRYEEVPTVHAVHADSIQTTDLLTQAMSELTQSLQEYRPGATEYRLASHLTAHAGGGPAMVQIQPSQLQHSTIELSHLGQALAHTQFNPQQTHIVQVNGTTVIAAAAPGSAAGGQQPMTVSVVTSSPSQGIPGSLTLPLSLTATPVPLPTTPVTTGVQVANGQTYVPKTWSNATYQTFR